MVIIIIESFQHHRINCQNDSFPHKCTGCCSIIRARWNKVLLHVCYDVKPQVNKLPRTRNASHIPHPLLSSNSRHPTPGCLPTKPPPRISPTSPLSPKHHTIIITSSHNFFPHPHHRACRQDPWQKRERVPSVFLANIRFPFSWQIG
jgi:hypothetical protein